jgi:hypothetical protein
MYTNGLRRPLSLILNPCFVLAFTQSLSKIGYQLLQFSMRCRHESKHLHVTLIKHVLLVKTCIVLFIDRLIPIVTNTGSR